MEICDGRTLWKTDGGRKADGRRQRAYTFARTNSQRILGRARRTDMDKRAIIAGGKDDQKVAIIEGKLIHVVAGCMYAPLEFLSPHELL